MAIVAEKESRTPIREKALPLPGGSLRREMVDLLADLSTWLLIVTSVAGVSAQQWFDYFWPHKPAPIFWTAVLMIVAVIALVRCRPKWRKFGDISLGLDGERAVADALNELREAGYRVYHDLQEEGYNIDHVVIGPGGVFAIETKTRRKRRNQRVVFDGQTVLVGGFKPDRDPIAQAQACARRVRDILKQQAGKDVWVKPAVLFPGWYVDIRKRSPDLFVGNEKLFVKSFTYEHAQQVLSREEVDELARAIERHLRR